MADKLGTQFTPIVNPAGARLLTLIDEVTGERYKISITDFFALVDTNSFQLGGNLQASNVVRGIRDIIAVDSPALILDGQNFNGGKNLARIRLESGNAGGTTGQIRLQVENAGLKDALIIDENQKATFKSDVLVETRLSLANGLWTPTNANPDTLIVIPAVDVENNAIYECVLGQVSGAQSSKATIFTTNGGGISVLETFTSGASVAKWIDSAGAIAIEKTGTSTPSLAYSITRIR